MTKKILNVLFIMCLCFAIGCPNVNALSAKKSGSCGSDLTWVLNSDGVLTINGTGKMDNFEEETPWEDYLEDIKKVTLSEGITSIGDDAFHNCEYMTEIELPSSLTHIGSEAFLCCFALKTISLPESVTSIDDLAFDGCDSLTSITLPGKLTKISYAVLGECAKLKTVNMPDGIEEINEYAFFNCPKLTSVTMPKNLKTIGDSAFKGTALASVSLPAQVTTIGEDAFCYCKKMTKITIPESVTKIKRTAFNYCDALTSVTYKGTKSQWDKISIHQSKVTFYELPNFGYTKSSGWPLYSNDSLLTAKVHCSNKTIYAKSTSLSKLAAAKKALTVKWKKQTKKVTGYHVQIAIDKNFRKSSKIHVIKNKKTASKKITKLKAKKKYYVRVRTYYKNGKHTYYSKWTKYKTKKTK